jgi:ABC-2 type transport system ATP-binding protein
LHTVDGQAWEWVVPGTALQEIKQRCLVSSTIRRSDGIQVRAVSDVSPAPEARAVSPTIEDAYLRLISGHRSAKV